MKKIIDGLELHYGAGCIKDEPMLYSASPRFAVDYGGSITREIIFNLGNRLPPKHTVIDTRVHMLKPGWSPSIPGWHCDAIPRDENKQLNFEDPCIPFIRHYLVVIDSGTASLTEFVRFKNPVDWRQPEPGENVWGARSRQIEEMPETEKEIVTVESGAFYEFDCSDYHRSTLATGHGWRFFFRASVNTRTRGPFNEIRKQVQVYIPDEHLGW